MNNLVKKITNSRNSYFLIKFKLFILSIIKKKITLRKLVNLIVCNVCYLLKLKKSGISPILVSIDLWNECNENCVFCRDEKGNIYNLNSAIKDKVVPKLKLDLQHYKNVVDAFKKDAMIMIPYINGEPLMYKGIYEAIDYTSKAKTLTLIASNGILLNLNNSEKLIKSGLDFLKVHISGFSNSVHQIQHRKGNVDFILKNLENFMKLKKKYNSKIIVMLDYILYKHNEHEVDSALNFANKNKIIFNIRPGNPKGMEDTEVKQRKNFFDKSIPCDWPWKALSLNNNKEIYPCCEYTVWLGDGPYGKIDYDTNFNELWKGEKVKNFRSSHINNGRKDIDICKNCDRQGIGFKF